MGWGGDGVLSGNEWIDGGCLVGCLLGGWVERVGIKKTGRYIPSVIDGCGISRDDLNVKNE